MVATVMYNHRYTHQKLQGIIMCVNIDLSGTRYTTQNGACEVCMFQHMLKAGS